MVALWSIMSLLKTQVIPVWFGWKSLCTTSDLMALDSLALKSISTGMLQHFRCEVIT